MTKTNVLIVDDEPNVRLVLSEALGSQGYVCAEAGDGHTALEHVKQDHPDIVILDLKMPGMSGMEALKEIRVLDPDAAVIIVTAFGTRETAYEAIREGAYDYFSKPVDIHDVRVVVGRAAERVRLLRDLRKHKEKEAYSHTSQNILGESVVVRRLRELLLRLSRSDSTVLITGESGTGKELAARILHHQSERRNGPFVAVNCAAIPETLLEAELFGHEKGAFTGAQQQRIGRFESADNGTVFLDEIGDMPPAMQIKMLRVLQERTFERVGGAKPVHVDIRLIAATNRDLALSVREGQFREDLFYRLNVVPVHIPPLRDRVEDVPLLAEFFLQKLRDSRGIGPKRLSGGALLRLREYAWPGNVRELDNIIQRAVLLAEGDEITESEMVDILGAGASRGQAFAFDPDLFTDPEKRKEFTLQGAVEEVTDGIERRIIEKALTACGGKRNETADMLKISRKSLHNKMKKYGMR
ncbi:MAG TPA: two-component system response regulator [Nitrospiraceae bacterium]|nr:two-component system response regulator [Nitrospiraceae bacterium]